MKRTLTSALLIAAALLSGCTTTRYITVPCVTDKQLDEIKRAEPPKVKDRLTGKADEDTRTLAGSALRLRSWGQGAVTLLEGCKQ